MLKWANNDDKSDDDEGSDLSSFSITDDQQLQVDLTKNAYIHGFSVDKSKEDIMWEIRRSTGE